MIVFIEPTASIISPDFFKGYALPYLSKVAKSTRAPTVLHIYGASMQMMESVAELGFNGISIDQKVRITNAKSAICGRRSLIGNLNPAPVLQTNTAQGVEKECATLLSEGVSVLAPGRMISSYPPTANITTTVKARDKYFRHSS